MIDSDCRQPFERCFCCLSKARSGGEADTDFSLDEDGKCYCCPVRIGGFIMLCGKRSLPYPLHCIIGADWPMVVLVYALILTINIVVLKVIAVLRSPLIPIGIFGFCFLLCSYTCVACSDPGIVYRKRVGAAAAQEVEMVSNDEDRTRLIGTSDGCAAEVVEVDALETSHDRDEDATVHNAATAVPCASKTLECGACKLQRPPSARHCYFCRTCVDELDHHCPWSGKCIGGRNIHFFSAFLASLCCQTYFLIGAFIYFCYFALNDEPREHLRGGDTGAAAGNHTAVQLWG